MKHEQVDVIIIGGGPVGLFAAFYSGMRQMSVKVIESLPQIGGQLAALYPEKYIYDIAGFPKVKAQVLIDNLVEQMSVFEQTICLSETVTNIEKQSDGTFVVKTDKEIHYTKAVIITAGNGSFKPRPLDLDGVAVYENKNLHYFVGDMNKYKDKEVMILGGGDSAVDWALMLEPIAKQVTLVHRRDQFRAHEHSVSLLQNSKIKVMTPYVPVDFTGDDHSIKTITVEHTKTKAKETIAVDDVLVTYGFVSSLGPIRDWGLEVEKNNIVVDTILQTSIPGIFACGDICTYEGKIKLIAVGFGEVPIAVNQAKMYGDPTAKIGHLHSTSIMDSKVK